MSIDKESILEYHTRGRNGKIEVVSTKPCQTADDLAMAYTPGVAVPVREIADNPVKAYEYTARGNLVAVVTNGTAILGLGSLGALASKPVMEGKAVLFKRFADVDVFDLELDTLDPDEIIRTCELLEPTFGGINLEDIKAPECFYIEDELKKRMKIPVFHDDQHGTAIIAGAGIINAVEIAGKKMEDIRIVVNGAGAAGIASAKHIISLGAKRENIVMCDSKGVIYNGRDSVNEQKAFFSIQTGMRTLEDAVRGADVFFGLSKPNTLSKDMLRSMAERPIVFAMANPDPEITYDAAKEARDDVIMATGRSDYPNQVNNVLGFPFIFRGALDVSAYAINDEMKIAATHALAEIARKPVPEAISRAYGGRKFKFGPDYIIPTPFDPRVLPDESVAVARAAIESGVARKNIDLDEYRKKLQEMSVRINNVPADFPF